MNVRNSSYGNCDVGRHSRLATLLHKLADAVKTDDRTVSVTDRPRPLSLTPAGAISDVEVGKVGFIYMRWFIASDYLLIIC